MSIRLFSLRRLLAVTTALGLVLPAHAQDDESAPPARVGQIADVQGNVSYTGAGSNGQWVAATTNYPVTAGDSLFTQSGGQAGLVLDSSRLTLAPDTELQVTRLDDQNFTATESQGEIFVDLANLQPGQVFILDTPRGAVTLQQDGEYDVAAGDADNPTTLSVFSGAASIGAVQVPAGQEGFLSGTDQTTAQLGEIQQSDFAQQMQARLAPPPPPYAPPVVRQMTGVSELSRYGSWDNSPQYGAVWYPQVSASWAPYRDGHWAYISPWGWTWVDNAPWGFAPFHYGRWIQNGPRWGWVPAAAYTPGAYAPRYQPVYAPAVVSFFGIAAGVAITASVLASHDVGWVPLAPGEAYYPPYHAPVRYVQRVNRIDVHDYTRIDNIHNTIVINHYANRRGATYVRGEAMAHGQPIGHYGKPMPEHMFADAHPVGPDIHAFKPRFAPHTAPAPHPSAFARRHDIPHPVISHEPPNFRPPGTHPYQMGHGGAPPRPPSHPRPAVEPVHPGGPVPLSGPPHQPTHPAVPGQPNHFGPAPQHQPEHQPQHPPEHNPAPPPQHQPEHQLPPQRPPAHPQNPGARTHHEPPATPHFAPPPQHQPEHQPQHAPPPPHMQPAPHAQAPHETPHPAAPPPFHPPAPPPQQHMQPAPHAPPPHETPHPAAPPSHPPEHQK